MRDRRRAVRGGRACAGAGPDVVGFAAEHGPEGVERARAKLERKGLDAIVVNDISRADIGFDSDQNEVTIVGRGRRAARAAQLARRRSPPRARLRAGAALQPRTEPAQAREPMTSDAARPRLRRRLRALPARPVAARRESLGAGGRLAREGEAPRARQDLDPRGARARLLPQRPLPPGGRASSPPSSSATRPTTTRTSASGARSRSSATAARAQRHCRSPAACARTATDYRLYRDRVARRPESRSRPSAVGDAGADPARQRGVRLGRRRGRRRDRRGALVLLGVGGGTASAQAARLADKVARLRVFDDERRAHGPLAARPRRRARSASASSRSTATPGGGCARASPRPPSPSAAERLYERFCRELEARGVRVERGRFGARMSVALRNEGPVTLLLEA